MLPKNIFRYLPDPLAENINSDGEALVDLLDTFCAEIQEDILSLWYIKFPEKTKEATLEEWNDYLSADFLEDDTVRTKRQKIASAVRRHKSRGTWKFDIKPKIDAITGKDSILVESTAIFEEDDSVIVADNDSENSSFFTIGTDGAGEYGAYIPDLNSTVELVPGVKAIDLGYKSDEIFDFQDDDSIITSDNSTENLYYSSIGVDGIDDELGTFIPDGNISDSFMDLLDKLNEELLESVPAYIVVYLGYTDVNGNYIPLKIVEE